MAASEERKEFREVKMRLAIKLEELARLKDEISALRDKQEEMRAKLSD
ncbi:hypothetical protein [Mangrovicoccus algicola]|uniref:Uncharacterized protein n=1 Tax=Mangrovicoccus algicola TaxID=2771008 RepID=A0A8J7CJ92_9RHOB|nr:hypothetical protein [Mangrovicoccus algicola]MBE3637441.1 hypothetical protein [Mangrovicoccus algicola]